MNFHILWGAFSLYTTKRMFYNKTEVINMANKLAEVLLFIKDYPHQYSPSVREIAEGVGLSSPATVQRYLYLLEQQGLLRMSLTVREQSE